MQAFAASIMACLTSVMTAGPYKMQRPRVGCAAARQGRRRAAARTPDKGGGQLPGHMVQCHRKQRGQDGFTPWALPASLSRITVNCS